MRTRLNFSRRDSVVIVRDTFARARSPPHQRRTLCFRSPYSINSSSVMTCCRGNNGLEWRGSPINDTAVLVVIIIIIKLTYPLMLFSFVFTSKRRRSQMTKPFLQHILTLRLPYIVTWAKYYYFGIGNNVKLRSQQWKNRHWSVAYLGGACAPSTCCKVSYRICEANIHDLSRSHWLLWNLLLGWVGSCLLYAIIDTPTTS